MFHVSTGPSSPVIITAVISGLMMLLSFVVSLLAGNESDKEKIATVSFFASALVFVGCFFLILLSLV